MHTFHWSSAESIEVNLILIDPKSSLSPLFKSASSAPHSCNLAIFGVAHRRFSTFVVDWATVWAHYRSKRQDVEQEIGRN